MNQSRTLHLQLAPHAVLELGFDRVADRYRHYVALVGEPGGGTLLRSVEGDALQAWPDSPPLQQLSIEQLDGHGRVALLVGMAGNSHWSASFSVLGDPPGFHVDMACRAQRQPDWLGCCYEAADDSHCHPFSLVLRAVAHAAGSRPAITRGGPHWRVDAGIDCQPPFTIRWQYRIEAVPRAPAEANLASSGGV